MHKYDDGIHILTLDYWIVQQNDGGDNLRRKFRVVFKKCIVNILKWR